MEYHTTIPHLSGHLQSLVNGDYICSVYKDSTLLSEYNKEKWIRYVLDDGNILEFTALSSIYNPKYSFKIKNPQLMEIEDLTDKKHHPRLAKLVKNNMKQMQAMTGGDGLYQGFSNLLFALENSKDLDISNPFSIFSNQKSVLYAPSSREDALSILGLQMINKKDYLSKPVAIPLTIEDLEHQVTVVYGPEINQKASNIVVNHGAIIGETKSINDRIGAGTDSKNYKMNGKFQQNIGNCAYISNSVISKFNKEVNKLVENGANFDNMRGRHNHKKLESFFDARFTKKSPNKNGVIYKSEPEYVAIKGNVQSGLFSIIPNTPLLGLDKNFDDMISRKVKNEIGNAIQNNDILRDGWIALEYLKKRLSNLDTSDVPYIMRYMKSVVTYYPVDPLDSIYNDVKKLDTSIETNRNEIVSKFKDYCEVYDISEMENLLFDSSNIYTKNIVSSPINKSKSELSQIKIANDLKSKYNITKSLMTESLFREKEQNERVITSTINKLSVLRGENSQIYKTNRDILLQNYFDYIKEINIEVSNSKNKITHA